MTLWNNYKRLLFEKFDLKEQNTWAEWQEKDANLVAKTYTGEYILKSREVDIWDKRANIYNNIIYPKTGANGWCGNLPCFGMDLMGFNEKRVIIVFDFQHPVENYLMSVPALPKYEGDYRFFEKGNHFSENIYIAYCTMDEVDDHLEMFEKYLDEYEKLLEWEIPDGTDTKVYEDFDNYMIKLDPVAGYLKGKFGADKAHSLVHDFLFEYGTD